MATLLNCLDCLLLLFLIAKKTNFFQNETLMIAGIHSDMEIIIINIRYRTLAKIEWFFRSNTSYMNWIPQNSMDFCFAKTKNP